MFFSRFKKKTLAKSYFPLFYEFFLEQLFNSLSQYYGVYQATEILGCMQSLQKKINQHIIKWEQDFEQLPVYTFKKSRLESPSPCVFFKEKLSLEEQFELEKQLKKWSPWRQGAYQIGPVYIDSEWVSFFKWNRLLKILNTFSLVGKTVLEIGCSNGYFSYQMKGKGASFVLGLEPYWLPFLQGLVLQRFFKEPSLFAIPLRLEDFQLSLQFDVVLHMGVLYHQKDYKQHLKKLFSHLKKGGKAYIETIYYPSSSSLFPLDKVYAGMTNVYNVPCLEELLFWIRESVQGSSILNIVDKSVTSFEEQRQTSWSSSYSLEEYLDPRCLTYTQEGYLRPHRVLIEVLKT